MRNKLLIIGASGHGKVIADIAMKMNRWTSIAFLDDDQSIKTSMELDVIGTTADAFMHKDEADFFVAIGNNATREKLQERLLDEGLSIVNLIHPSAVIGTDVEIDVGTVVMAGVVINCCCSIGRGCIVNTGAIIDHDSVIEDYVHISPGVNVAGSVSIGKGTWIGIGSVISNNINICQSTIVGAGTVVISSIYRRGVYVGAPARRISS